MKELAMSSRVLKFTRQLNPTLIRYGPLNCVKKEWGRELWLVNEPEYCAKILELKPGFTSSLHFHPRKKETFIVTTGVCNLVLGKETMRVGTGGVVTIPANTPHKFFLRNSDRKCKVLEISMYHDDADVVRLEPSGKVPYGG